jgi:hypothetical protein
VKDVVARRRRRRWWITVDLGQEALVGSSAHDG